MDIKRGDIWYVEKSYYSGSEQGSGRPAIIVSNDKNNQNSEVVEAVYLTTAPKKDLPTHVTIRSSERDSIAICEQITAVSVDRLQNFKGRVTAQEMMNIEIAMMVSLDVYVNPAPAKKASPEKAPEPAKAPEKEIVEVPVIDQKIVEELEKTKIELAASEAKANMLRAMYDDLLKKTMEVARA